MGQARKYFALLVAFSLVLAALVLTGCGGSAKSEGNTSTPAQTEPAGIKSVDDLKSGDKVAVQSGTTGEAWAKENLAPKGVVVTPYDDILAAFAALQAGDVVAVLNDLPISQDIAKDPARGVEVVQEIQTDEQYGFAFKKDNDQLREAVNWGLAEVIKEGKYNEIYKKWFGSEPLSMPEVTSTPTPPSGTPKTLNAGKLVIGSDTAFPPFENIEGGKAVGFDVDLMTAIAEKIGLTAEFKTYKFDALITGLQSGTEFDMVASAMTIKPERAKSVDFSDPYINSNQSLAIKKAQ